MASYITFGSWTHEETATYLHLQDRVKVANTLWADEDILKEMGIDEEVDKLFNKMDLGHMIDMHYPTYIEPTLQFLSTFEWRKNQGEAEYDRGSVYFKIEDKAYEISINTICEVFGFAQYKKDDFYRDTTESFTLWEAIAYGDYDGVSAHISKIRNPVLRYAMEFLNHTFIIARDPKKVEELGLKILYQGLKGTYRYSDLSQYVELYGNDVNNGSVMVRQLEVLRERIIHGSETVIRCGGLLTPLFLRAGINLKKFTKKSGRPSMDMRYLCNRKFLHGYDHREKVIYFFQSAQREPLACHLPLPEYTNIADENNLGFELPSDYLINRHAFPEVPRYNRLQPRTEPKERSSDPIGYEPFPYPPPQSSGPETELETYLKARVAHQDKILKKQGKFLSKIKDKFKRFIGINRYVSSSEEEEEDAEEVARMRASDFVMPPRHSIANPPLVIREPQAHHHQEQSYEEDQPRSSTGSRARRKGKAAATPSTARRYRTRSSTDEHDGSSSHHSFD